MKSAMSRARSILAATATVVALIGPSNAPAQWVVFDPANLIENVISAIKAISQEANQLEQLKEQVKSNLSALPVAELSGAYDQLSRLQDLYSSAQALKSTLGSGESALRNIQSTFGASNLSWQDFAASLARRKAAGDANANNLLAAADAATRQIQASQDAHQKIVSSLSGVSGATEAAQATATAVGTVIQQNQAMLGVMSSMASDQGILRAQQARNQADTDAAKAAWASSTSSAYGSLQANPSLFTSLSK